MVSRLSAGRASAFGSFVLIAAIVAMVALPSAAWAQSAEDTAAVRRAALDYLEGFYEGDASKLERSVRPEVVKYGFGRGSDGGVSGSVMTFEQMLSFAASVKASGRTRPASDPKEVEILDILDQTAAVKVTAYWGSDYMQLAKYDGKWMILHVLWQAPSGDGG